MNPGRELDILVATRVMGYERWIDKGVEWYETKELRVRLNEGEHRLPHFSTDVAAAWQVLGKLYETHSRFGLIFDDGIWNMKVDSQNESDFIARSGTAPHAICLAALKSVGVEV